MPREGKAGYKQNGRKKIHSQNKGSDESDEDYIVKEDEELDDLDEYCSSFEDDESEDSLVEFEEEEEEENVKKVARPKKGRKGFQSKRKNRVKKLPKRRRMTYREEEEEKEEEDNDDDDDDEDEEFTPDEIDSLDDEEELPVIMKNKKVGRPPSQGKGFARGQKRRRNSKVMKKTIRKKPRKNRRSIRKASSSNGRGFTARKLGMAGSTNKISSQTRSRLVSDSDSDFVTSGSSDYEYTISEEEREQVREASEFCQNLTTSLRSSSLSRRLQKEDQDRKVVLHHQRKRSVRRKGKEKVEDLKNEVGKQVCGICLSEEDKMTLRGTLNCCSHYFCFACIMEWSKVESRCPLCKQRFVTISKPARSGTVFDLRTVVIPVPERDQVYQPSEEELRGYLDPYENVICTECQQGGDDALMLLCDLCDSPAHTYCVGLGHEVPEGNWYCEGCRPTALTSSNPQSLNPEQRTSNLFGGSSPIGREGLDLNVAYVPDVPSAQEIFPFARRSNGDIQAPSSSGSGAVTVSDRRRIQRQIHHFLSSRIRQSAVRRNGISSTISGNRLFGDQFDQRRHLATQHMITPERVASNSTFFVGGPQDNTTSFTQNRDIFSARTSNSRDHFVQNPTYTSVSGGLPAELAGISTGINSRLGNEQFLPCSTRSSIGSDATMSPLASGEVSHFSVQMEQVQSMVRSHLKSLSRDMELGNSTLRDIARRSTHTILAACGLQHQGSEVYPVDVPSICDHIERVAIGQTSLMTGHCSSCFDLFVRNVVGKVMIGRFP